MIFLVVVKMNLMMILAMMVLVVKRCMTTTWSAHQYQILDKVIPVIRDDDLGNDGEVDKHLVSAPVPDTRQGHPSDQTRPRKVPSTNVHWSQHVQEVLLNC